MNATPSNPVNRHNPHVVSPPYDLYLCLDDVEGDGPCDDIECHRCGKGPTYRFQWRQTSDWESSLWLCRDCGEKESKALATSRNGENQEIRPPAILSGPGHESRSEPSPENTAG